MIPRLALLIIAVLVASAASAHGAPDPGRLDPRLVPAAIAGGADTVAVFVRFADHGEQGPADLAARLAGAAAQLDPHARARRARAHVIPLVDERDLPVDPAYLSGLRALGCAPYAVSRWFNQAAVHVPAARLMALAHLPFVALVTPIPFGRVIAPPDPTGAPSAARASTPATRLVSTDYGRTIGPLQQLALPAVHDSGYIGTGVRICMLDDGFNAYRTHEALAPIDVPAGWTRDFVDGDSDPTDSTSVNMWHGAATLGCAGGNAPGIYVGAGYGASFMLARTELHGSEHYTEMVNWDLGAEWADSLGADIISSSLGYTTFDAPDSSYTYADMDGHTTIVTRAAEIAASKGMLVVNAEGNLRNTPWHYMVAPADMDGDSLIAAGAVDSFGAVTSTSSPGPTADGRIKPDLAARGIFVPCVNVNLNPLNGYQQFTGTSFSAPLIAGTCACLIQARPWWSPRTLIAALKSTASRASDPDTLTGWGVPNALAVLQWGGPGPPPPPPPARPGIRLLGPNPARGGEGVVVRVTGSAGPVRVRILDVTGRTVRAFDAAPGDIRWDGRAAGRRRPGVYLLDVRAPEVHAVLRVAVL